MKILYILNITSRVNNFSEASMNVCLDNKIEFHIAGNWGYKNTEEKRNDEEKYGIKICQIDFERNPLHPKNLIAFKQLIELMKKEKFDIVHCNTPVGGVYGRIAAKICGIKKVIYQAHGFHFYKGASKLNWLVYYPIEKILAHLTDALITINFEDYDISKKFKLRNKGKSYYVPGVGFDIESSKKINISNIKIREKLDISIDDIVCISAGELNNNKNNIIILEALNMLKNSKIHYLLCGVGNLKEKLVQYSLENNLGKNVHFLGYRDDVKELLKVSDIFIMPSFREGLSRSIMEAMASGLPCVVSNIRGNRDLIENEKGGFLVNPTDSEEFAKKINLLVNNSELREKMKNYNLERIKSFDIKVIEKELEKIYKEILKK
ncbi:MAG: glycosyltransferase family 4 protein [Fusobacterium sp.]|uniref:glycosyltransferase family 4 protein n=1 Tax=Fusobacterium sp. TaxID=68766 RepID=UPI002A761740|nr:glycosyltransferase family 4 protein [Fusobacterium sp.]MDY2980857.1 glycosyltransferase family 4 protein [Fusobacterium sp.]